MARLPKIANLMDKYPTVNKAQLAKLVGGVIGSRITKHDWETCCIRLTYALNHTGAPVEGFESIRNPYGTSKDGKIRVYKGADGSWYIASTYDLRAYLTGRYGPPTKYKKKSDVDGIPGILMFGFRHVDIWDGSKAKWLNLFNHSSVKQHGLPLWPVPS